MKKIFLLVVLSSLFTFFITYSQENTGSADVSPYLTSQPVNPNATEAIWDVLFNYNLQTATGGLGNAGAVYIPTLDRIWVSRWSTPAGRIYVLNTSGMAVDSFTTSFTGTRGMCFDGQYVYHAINTTTVQKVDPVTRLVVGTINVAGAPNGARFIAYNPNADGGNGGIIVGNWTSPNLNFYEFSMTGTLLRTITNTVTGVYGIAYDYWSPGGPFLWVWSQGSGQGFPQNIQQMNYTTGLYTGIQHDVITDVGAGQTTAIAGGLFISPDLVPGKVTLGGVLQGAPDRLFGYELVTLDAGVLAPFNLTSPPPGVTVTSIPASSSPITITWDTSRAGATYKWVFGAPTVPPRILTVSSTSNSLTLTLGQLDNILAGLGLAQGDSIVGQWDVWAFRNNAPDYDSLKSANGPRAITFKRLKPTLNPFSLVSPPDNFTLVTSAFNNSPVNITWQKSGDAVTYKWKYGSALNTKSGKAAILTLPSNNGGYDTVLTVINSALDGVLAGLGIAPGDSSVAQWTVYAYSGSDSLKAVETFNITLKRQAKGDVLVTYDSASVLGRTSRDSVVAVLSRNGITFDLFNKGGQTSTSVISFRGYKKIFWLGEGTSVMSVVQKDSIKTYLNSGTPDNRSQLIIFSEDIGYQLGRTASTYYDLDFMNNYLGANYLLDRPASGAAQGLIGLAINAGQTDSTIGSWPDVLGIFGASEALYRFRYDPTAYNAIGNKTPNFEVATFGVDIESLRPAIDSPPGSPVERMVMAAYNYLVIPVELTSFTSTVSGNNVLLSWSTATEVNNSGFQVERKTVDGNYTSIGFVQGKGTTTEIQDYIFTDNNLVVGKYSYRLKQIDFNGTYQYGPEVEVEIGLPLQFELSQNYPNPFNPTTSIKFSLVSDSRVSLKLFDVIGQEVMTIINTDLAAGYHSTLVDGSKLSSGVYIYRLDAAGTNGQKYTSVKKMILTK